MLSYWQAVSNQWSVAYHRMAYAKSHEGKRCKCDYCREHLEAIERGPEPQKGDANPNMV